MVVYGQTLFKYLVHVALVEVASQILNTGIALNKKTTSSEAATIRSWVIPRL
jgi:hypothetical protein